MASFSAFLGDISQGIRAVTRTNQPVGLMGIVTSSFPIFGAYCAHL